MDAGYLSVCEFYGTNNTKILRPQKNEDEIGQWLDYIQQDFIYLSERLWNKRLILDLSDLDYIPLSLLGMAFNLKQALDRRNSYLVLYGIKDNAISKSLWSRVAKRFTLSPPHPRTM